VTVYVDAERNPFGRMVMCHMFADTADELHAMAAAIGMKREWYQHAASFPHYDVSLARKARAVALGARLVDRREGWRIRKPIRQRIIDDPGFAASWRP
jgi:hypothetical protein